MKKIFLTTCSLFALSSSQLPAVETLLELKAAYFHPESTLFRKIYGSAGIYGAEVSVQTWCNLYAWVSGDFFIKSGHSIGLHDPTNIWFIPIGVGLKYFLPLNCWDFYFGAGFTGTYVHFHDHSPFVVQRSHNWAWGGIAKIGVMRTFWQRWFVDLFTSYSYAHAGFHEKHHLVIYRHEANLGGWAIGGGIGYRFGCREECCGFCSD